MNAASSAPPCAQPRNAAGSSTASGHRGLQQSVSETREVGILQDKTLALVGGPLEARRAGHELSLGDVVAMAATPEIPIAKESLDLLQT
eukprot:3491091-Pyramimonas_sp.AAC.1